MQLVYKHGLANHPAMEESIQVMFDTMSEFRLGQSSTLFHQTAKELGHLVLTNKKDQTTRFVRSAAHAMKAFFQNLPTLIMVLSKMAQDFILDGKNTKAKEIQTKINKIQDPRFLLRLLGLGQILEIYCKVSLEGQYSSHLPSQVWEAVNRGKAELEKLGSDWGWAGEDLKFIDVEAPVKTVERLLVSSTYKPKVNMKNVVRKGAELRAAGLLEPDERVSSLFENGYMVKPLAGEVLMQVARAGRKRRAAGRAHCSTTSDDEEMEDESRKIKEEDIEEVEKLLQGLSKSIIDQWNLRMVQSPLAAATCQVLGMAPTKEVIDDRLVFVDIMEEKLALLLSKLPDSVSQRFQVSFCRLDFLVHLKNADQLQVANTLDGYITYMELFYELQEVFHVHQIYEQWYRKYVMVASPEESSTRFSELFECVQVRFSRMAGTQPR